MNPKPRAYRLTGWDDLVATLAAIRDDRQITYATLGHATGTSRQEVSRWLHGKRMPLGHRLVDLIHALGYDIALIPRQPKEQP